MDRPQGYALITGASSGIGREFAVQLAVMDQSLILVARSQDRLAQLRDELIAAHPGIDVRCVALDLSASGAPAELFARTRASGLEVTLLINNAGFGAFGDFVSIDRVRQRQMLDLNIAALVELTHLYLQPMYSQGTGGIINVASVAGFVPLPYCAVYAATKAYVVSFSHALSEEARQKGVQVMVVNPGSTATNFFQVAGSSPFSHPARMQTPAQVVRESLCAFRRGRHAVTTGMSNRTGVFLSRFLPRNWVTSVVGRVMRRTMRPGS